MGPDDGRGHPDTDRDYGDSLGYPCEFSDVVGGRNSVFLAFAPSGHHVLHLAQIDAASLDEKESEEKAEADPDQLWQEEDGERAQTKERIKEKPPTQVAFFFGGFGFRRVMWISIMPSSSRTPAQSIAALDFGCFFFMETLHASPLISKPIPSSPSS